ncbi:hypothetical protein BT69DRAFT_1297267 [Atractiella rhizophila]|nr:hypothetical protein BT69DRAFT_1297267 [Atractiella rhizophila]
MFSYLDMKVLNTTRNHKQTIGEDAALTLPLSEVYSFEELDCRGPRARCSSVADPGHYFPIEEEDARPKDMGGKKRKRVTIVEDFSVAQEEKGGNKKAPGARVTWSNTEAGHSKSQEKQPLPVMETSQRAVQDKEQPSVPVEPIPPPYQKKKRAPAIPTISVRISPQKQDLHVAIRVWRGPGWTVNFHPAPHASTPPPPPPLAVRNTLNAPALAPEAVRMVTTLAEGEIEENLDMESRLVEDEADGGAREKETNVE